jgi:hypothetical protein
MSNKQSSVEYLIDYLLPKALTVEQYYHIEKAKAMHKEEIKKSYDQGDMDLYLEETSIRTFKDAEQYYNETFEQ